MTGHLISFYFMILVIEHEIVHEKWELMEFISVYDILNMQTNGYIQQNELYHFLSVLNE